MKVALLGDVHANLPALEAVLEDAQRRGVEAIWNLGDLVGYGAFPNEVVELLRQTCDLGIVGNYDLKMLRIGQEGEKKGKGFSKRMAFRWAYEHLSKANRKYLRALSRELRLEVEGRRVLLTHSSPNSDTEYLTPDTPEERLSEIASTAKADVIICGHSHQPFARKVSGVWFINTGSVGRPDDGDPRACYAILHLQPRFTRVYHYRIEYDVDRAVAAIRAYKLPEEFAQMILQGRSLEAIEESAPAVPPGSLEEGEPSSGGEEASPPVQETIELVPLQAEEVPVSLPAPLLSSEEQAQLEAAQRFARSTYYEKEHTEQVIRLALRLFDELQPLHGLGPKARFWLQCAAVLHDVGWVRGWRAHHKTSLRLILDTPLLPFSERERLIVGSIARYHRRALPQKKHKHFRALKARDQHIVAALAGILRVADALDCTHQGLVADVMAHVSDKEIIVDCAVHRLAEAERQDASKKGRLLEETFGRRLVLKWHLI